VILYVWIVLYTNKCNPDNGVQWAVPGCAGVVVVDGPALLLLLLPATGLDNQSSSRRASSLGFLPRPTSETRDGPNYMIPT
jgi:hypothetical protein